MENSMKNNPSAKTEKGNSKTGLGKMWAYFAIWVAFIALGVLVMAKSDTKTVKDKAAKEIEKKEVKEANVQTAAKNDKNL